ncbi:MAG TPA: Hsp70 family protein, partial [Polyangiaceae bacterium]
ELEKVHGKPFKRADPALAPSLRRLRAACEEAKMDLGRGKTAVVSLADPLVLGGEEIVVDVPIEASTFDTLVLPIVDRSVEVCLRLLARQGLEPKAIGRLVLVGGPTVMPVLRSRLENRLGIALATDVDPMTAVAEGAAMFAREHDLGALSKTASTVKTAPSAPAGKAEQAWLQYPSVSGDLHPFVVGRVAPKTIATVVARRTDDAQESVEEKVGDDGTFAIQVELRPRTTTTFDLLAKNAEGKVVPIAPSTVSIRHGLSLADPPLSRTIGVALADGGVAVYFERGAPLPSKKSFRLRTSTTVDPGEHATLLSVPIVQGDAPLAHLCRLVGKIEIRPDVLKDPLAAGSPVDVVLEVDRGGKLSATAEIPSLGTSFPGTLLLVSPDSSLAELGDQLERLRQKTEQLYVNPYVEEPQKEELVAVDGRLDEAGREHEAAKGGDPDAIEKLRRLLGDVDETLAEIEAKKSWPELEQAAMSKIAFAVQWVARNGTDMERKLVDEALRSIDRARAVRNAADFERRIGNLVRLGEAAWLRDPGELTGLFKNVAQRLGEMRDPREANQLVAKGEAALANRDFDEVRRTTYALLDKLPPREQTRIRAHRSGVER